MIGENVISGYKLNTEDHGDCVYITACEATDSGASDELVIPDTIDGKPVKGIDRKAFLQQVGLRKVVLPGTVAYIGDWAFSQCRQLETFILKQGAGVDAFVGRGIFEGSDRLANICIGYTKPDELSFLAALPVKRLPAAYLIKDPSFGLAEWYRKLDMAIVDYLKQDDIEGYSDRALCGEEDISYDGVGSVDGELPGESAAYLKEVGKNKAGLSFARLTNKVYITNETKAYLSDYLLSRSKGCERENAWYYILEDRYDDSKAIDDYLDIIKPDTDALKAMLEDVPPSKALLKSKLIAHKSGNMGDFFDDLTI